MELWISNQLRICLEEYEKNIVISVRSSDVLRKGVILTLFLKINRQGSSSLKRLTLLPSVPGGPDGPRLPMGPTGPTAPLSPGGPRSPCKRQAI